MDQVELFDSLNRIYIAFWASTKSINNLVLSQSLRGQGMSKWILNTKIGRLFSSENVRFTTLLVGAAILEAAGYIALPFLTLHLRDQFGFSIEMAGLVISVGIWLRPLASIFGGCLSGKLHGKWMFSLACLCEAVCFFLLGNAHSTPLAILGLMLGNVGFAIWAPNLYAIATDAGPKNLELSRLSKLNGFINSGAALGCVAGGFLASIDAGFVFKTAGTLYLGIFLLLFPLVASWKAPPTLVKKKTTHANNTVFSPSVLIKTTALTLLFWSSYGQFNTFFAMYAKDWLGSTTITGAAFAALAIGVSIFSSLLSKSIKLQESLSSIANFSLSGLAFGWGLLTLSPNLISAAIFILALAIAETVLSVFLAEQWNRSFTMGAGRAQGFHFAVRNIGMGLGGLVGGLAYYGPGTGNLLGWFILNCLLLLGAMFIKIIFEKFAKQFVPNRGASKKKKILIVEPGFQNYKEPIVAAIFNTGLADLYFATGLDPHISSEWVKPYAKSVIHFSYNKNNLIETIEQFQKENELVFDGAMTYIETSVHFVNQLQHKLGLPRISSLQGKEIRSKSKMRVLFNAAEVTQPKFKVLSSPDEITPLIRSNIRFPVIVKPAEMMSSLAVRKVDCENELASAVAAAAVADFDGESLRDLYGDISKEVLIEEFIGGYEYSVEVLVSNGICKILGITKKQTTNSRFFDELGHQFPAPDLDNATKLKIEEIVVKTHRALRLKNTCTHLEIKIDRGQPHVIELNCRLGGDLISELVRNAGHASFGEMILKTCLGEEIDNRESTSIETQEIQFFSTAKTGQIVKLPDRNGFDPSLKIEWFVKEGDLASPMKDNGICRLGYVMGSSAMVKKHFSSIQQDIIIYEVLASLDSGKYRIVVVPARVQDIDELVRTENSAWCPDQAATPETILKRIQIRNDTIIAAKDLATGKIYGFLTSAITKRFSMASVKSWAHYAQGLLDYDGHREHLGQDDALFLVSASVDPKSPKGIGSLLLRGAVEIARRNSIENVCYGGRLTAMQKRVKDGAQPQEVFVSLIQGEIVEPSIQMGLKEGFEPVSLIENYFEDPESLNFGILMTCKTVDKQSEASPLHNEWPLLAEEIFG